MKYGYILVCADKLPCIAVCECGFGITHHESRVDSQEGELTLFLFDCESVFTLHTRAIKLRANAILASYLELATQAET
jgi:hypothetical protein